MTRRIDFTGLRTFRPRLDMRNLGQTPGSAKPYQVRWSAYVINKWDGDRRAGIPPSGYASEESFKGRRAP